MSSRFDVSPPLQHEYEYEYEYEHEYEYEYEYEYEHEYEHEYERRAERNDHTNVASLAHRLMRRIADLMCGKSGRIAGYSDQQL